MLTVFFLGFEKWVATLNKATTIERAGTYLYSDLFQAFAALLGPISLRREAYKRVGVQWVLNRFEALSARAPNPALQMVCSCSTPSPSVHPPSWKECRPHWCTTRKPLGPPSYPSPSNARTHFSFLDWVIFWPPQSNFFPLGTHFLCFSGFSRFYLGL